MNYIVENRDSIALKVINCNLHDPTIFYGEMNANLNNNNEILLPQNIESSLRPQIAFYGGNIGIAEEQEEMINNGINQNFVNQNFNETTETIQSEEELDLKYGAEHIISTFIPVVLCMLLVVASLSLMPYYKIKDSYMIYTPFHEKTNDVGTKIWQSIANSVIVICVIIGVTCLFVMLYKYKCMKIILGWLLFASVVLMFMFFGIHLEQIFSSANLPIDYFTAGFMIYNYAILGLVVIHWKGPLRLHQAYLIVNSALFALTLIKYLPDWTTWVLLAFLSIWDLFAVLTPRGPLRALVEMAQERNDYFPSIIYSSTMLWTMTSPSSKKGCISSDTRSKVVNPSSYQICPEGGRVPNGDNNTNNTSSTSGGPVRRLNASSAAPERSNQYAPFSNISNTGQNASNAGINNTNHPPNIQPIEAILVGDGNGPDDVIVQVPPFTSGRRSPNKWHPENEEDRGIKIGLGDLVFYSVLVGKASMSGNWITTLSCFVAILIGLSLTLLLLAMFKKPLPALPISIFFGLVFYFSSRTIISPFLEALSDQNFFI